VTSVIRRKRPVDANCGAITDVINGLRNVNKPIEGTGMPQVSTEIQDMIIYENWKGFFPHWAYL
jgi:hypothetical protein